MTPSGAITEYTLPVGTSEPFGIVTGPDGNLWFTESGNQMMGRITTSGAISQFGLGLSFLAPVQVAVGSDKRLWITSQQSSRLRAMVP